MRPGERRKKKIRKFTRRMQKKLAILFICVVIVLIGLNIRITYINAESGEKYTKQVLDQQNYDSRIIPYKRGNILDSKGTKIATSEKVYNVILDAKLANGDKGKYKEATIKALAEYFGIEEEITRTELEEKSQSRYKVMKKSVSYNEAKKFLEFLEDKDKGSSIQGVWLEDSYIRKYPYHSLAAAVIGFASDANEGANGLEQYYNTELNGTNGREFGYWNDDSELERTIKSAKNGNHLVTNLDVHLQQIVENKITEFVELHRDEARPGAGAETAAVLMMNPNNGAVLAMGTNPSYDLNNPRDLEPFYSAEEIEAMDEEATVKAYNEIWKNFQVSEEFEPGSTVKPMTVASGLETGKLNGHEVYTCNGSRSFGSGKPINCVSVKSGGHGAITLEQAIMKSCNVALMSVGVDALGKDVFRQYQEVFNMGKTTGIDLPQEIKGVLQPEDMGIVDLATNAFGQNYDTTMIQVAAAFSSIINGGYYYQPQVASQIVDDTGAVVKNIEPILLKQTISKQTSETMKGFLLNTVDSGTAAPAQIEGYKIGGKTGTAQKQPREAKNYLVSFIGYVPHDNPQIVIYVVIDTPNVAEQSTGGLATHLAHDILVEALPYLNIYPTEGVTPESEDKENSPNEPPDDGSNAPAEEDIPDPGGETDGAPQPIFE